jgi:hypothetical protein
VAAIEAAMPSILHPKVMPVVLTTAEEVDLWSAADAPKALEPQGQLSDDAFKIVASGERRDGVAKGLSPLRQTLQGGGTERFTS